MRTKRALCNIISNIILQIIIAVNGVVLSRFILLMYGSSVNGMVNSISQFLVYAGLVDLGVGNAAIVALYKPISEDDWTTINAIVSKTKRKYFLSGTLYIVIVCVMALLYPIMIEEQLSYRFAFFMVIVIGASNLAEYFMLAKYRVFLSAIQKYYVLNIAKGISTSVAIILSIVLMLNHYSIIFVKGVLVLTSICEVFFVKCYVSKKHSELQYRSKVPVTIGQQRNSLIHQLSCMVIYNTDLIVLTVCLSENSLFEVSVYTVYALAYNMIVNLLNTLTNGVNSTFGDIISKGQKEVLRKWYDLYEYVYLGLIFSVYSCFMSMIIPFVRCYTSGINDTNYIRLSVGILFCMNGLSAHMKGASGVLITGAGHFKQTQKYVLAEAVLNIIISLLLVNEYGITGVLIGTVVSHVVANIGYINYANKVILESNSYTSWKRIVRNSFVWSLLSIIEYHFVYDIAQWKNWILAGMILMILNTLFFCFINLLLEPEKGACLHEYISKKLKRKNK